MTDEERRDLMQEERIARVLRRRVRDTRVPPFSAIEARLRRPLRLAPMLLTAAGVTVLALIVGTALGERRGTVGAPGTSTPSVTAPSVTAGPDASPTPLPTPTAAAAVGTPVSLCGTLIDYRAPTSTLIGSMIVDEEHFFVATDAQTNIAAGVTPGVAVCLDGRWIAHAAGRNLTQLTLTSRPGVSASPLAFVAYENTSLGYRISLPQAYRRYVASAGPDGAGTDVYTRRTGDLCVQSHDMDSDVQIEVVRSSLTPVEFASAPNRRMPFTSIQSVSVKGFTAARVVYDTTSDTEMYVISANARLYVIRPAIGSQPSRQPTGCLDRISQSL